MQGLLGGMKQTAAYGPDLATQAMPTEHLQFPGGAALSALWSGFGQSVLPGMADFADYPNTGEMGQTPSMPGAEQAGKDYAQVKKEMRDRTGVSSLATNPDEEYAQDVYGSAGAMSFPSPSAIIGKVSPAVAAIVAKLPSAITSPIQTIEHMMYPPPATAIGSGGVNAVAAGGLEATAKQPDQSPEDYYASVAKDLQAQGYGSQGSDGKPLPVPPIPPVGGPPPITPQGGAATLPFTTGSQTTDQNQQETPAYHTEGEQPGWYNTYPGRAAIIAGSLAAAWFGLKHGGSLLNTTIEGAKDIASGSGLGASRDVAAANARITAIDQGTVAPITGLPSGPARGEVPLPGGGDRPTARAFTSLVDRNATVNAYIDATAPTQNAADALKNAYATTNAAGRINARIEAQARTGVNLVDSTNGIKWADYLHDYGQLTDAQKAAFDSAMWRTREMDVRNELGTSDPNNRVNFQNEDNAQLRQNIALATQDPAVTDLMTKMHMTNVQINRDMFNNGLIDARTRQYLDMQHPFHMPDVDVYGNTKSELLSPNKVLGSGTQFAPTTAINAMTQKYFKAYSQIVQHNFLSDLIDNDLSHQYVNPNAAKIFTPVTRMKTTQARDPVTRAPITYSTSVPVEEGGSGRTVTRYKQGKPEVFEVNNTPLWNALQGGDRRIGMLMDTVNMMRRLNQAGETGVSGLLFNQRPFSIYHLARSGIAIPTARSPQFLGGPMDAMSRAFFGVPYRGIDPSFMTGSVLEGLKGAGAAIAKNLGDMLSMGSHPLSMALRARKGDIWTDALADWFKAKYANSLMAERARYMPGGGGTMGEVESPSGAIIHMPRSNSKAMGISPIANLEPGALGTKNWFTRLPGGQGTTAAYVNFRSLLRDIHREVADGGNAYFYRVNRDFNPNVSRETIARESQDILGDPTHSGAGRVAQTIGRTVPFINAMIQDTARMVRNFKNAPIAYPAALASTLTLITAAEVLSGMLGGPEHMKHMQDQMSANQTASDATIYDPNRPPEEHTSVSLPIMWRVFHPYFKEFMTTALGAWQVHKGEPEYNRIVNTLSDLFHHHVETRTDEAAMKGLSTTFDIRPGPLGEAPLAVFGKGMRSIGEALIRSREQGTPFFDNFITNTDDPSHIPGQTNGNTFVSNNDGQWVHDILNTFNAGFANAFSQWIQNPLQRMNEGANLRDALAASIGDMQQRWYDNTPMLNWIWHNNIELKKNNPLHDSVTNRLAALNAMPKLADFQDVGYASPGSTAPVTITGNLKYPEDPKMQDMLTVIDGFKTSLMPFTKQMYDIEAQMKELQSTGLRSEDKRQLWNLQMGRLDDAVAAVDKEMRWLDARLSEMADGRVVNLNSIDWSRGVDQFHY